MQVYIKVLLMFLIESFAEFYDMKLILIKI